MSVNHHSSVSVEGMNKLFKAIDNIAKWTDRDSRKLVEIGHKVGNVYANYLKANVKDLGKDITVRSNKFSKTVVKSGQLRRSSGTWQPDKNRNQVMAGPRTNSIGRRKTRKTADGWFAHIVEKGDFGPRFGGKHRTQNTGIFERGKKATQSRALKLQLSLYQKGFKRYVKKSA